MRHDGRHLPHHGQFPGAHQLFARSLQSLDHLAEGAAQFPHLADAGLDLRRGAASTLAEMPRVGGKPIQRPGDTGG